MIYLGNLENIEGDKYSVGMVHYMPFDPINGLGKNAEELTKSGLLVDGIPQPENIEGKSPIMFVNLSTKQIGYDYVDIPKTKEELLEEQLTIFQNKLKTADQKYKELDLSTADLQTVKDAKIAQLDELCNQTIVNGFDYDVNGISYHFSCSLSAQANFQGSDTLFKDGLINEAEWTVVNNTTSKTERIQIDQTTFNALKLQVFQHINSNISKLRNTLEPLVENESTDTNEKVDTIVW